MSSHIQKKKKFYAFLKVFKYVCQVFVFIPYFICVPSFKSMQFHSHSCKRLQSQNTSVGIELIKLTKTFNTLNYKPCLKYGIL